MAALRFTLRQMEIFSSVARCGSTASAAEDVSLSQSAVSAALNDLESALGHQLFDRIGKKLVLNAVGKALRSRAADILNLARGIETDFHGTHPTSHLKIAASTTIGNYLIPKLLTQYADIEPSRQVDVHIGNTSDVLRAVCEFKVDAGVIEGPCNTPGVSLRNWKNDELVVVASRQHPLAIFQRTTGQELDLPTLRKATWLVREEGSGTRDAVQDALSSHLGRVDNLRVLGSSEAIKRSVILGLGVSCLSRLLIDEQLQAGSLVELATELPAIQRSFHIVTHRERKMNEAAERFFALPCQG
ncbi:LysR family transcriptional regulator [uncultured Azohydromonas sp.]|jgi:Transcriptional regulator|uniref:LysR family transcriptional regulator n=1 Tax=uncultured Azohydromonas sp. TaxID=487342 RepID=UPI00262B5AF0|nr:LysR family transcriptional regulator [uncultured Azohydromonas sp.]